MQPAELFEYTLEWLKQHYSGYRFYAERDVVWTVQTRLNREIEKRGLPYRVFNDYRVAPRRLVDLVITHNNTVVVAVEFKYEPSHNRRSDRGGDILKGKLDPSVVDWKAVVEDIRRVQGYVAQGKSKTAYSVFIDEGGEFRWRTSPDGSEWLAWSGGGWMLWYKKSQEHWESEGSPIVISNTPNKDCLVRALDIYRDCMRDFIVRTIESQGIGIDAMRKSLNISHKHYDRSDERNAFDVGHFYRIIEHYWKESFKEAFNGDASVLNAIKQVSSIRNEAAHPAYKKDIDRAWALARIYDMSDILGRIGAGAGEARVQAIWDELAIQDVRLIPSLLRLERKANDAKTDTKIPAKQATTRAVADAIPFWVNRDSTGNTIHKGDEERCSWVDRYALEPKWEKHDTLESVYAVYPRTTRKCGLCFS